MYMGFIMRKVANNYGACMDLFQCADPLQPVKQLPLSVLRVLGVLGLL